MNNYSERQILNSKTPEQFIERCVYSTISRGRKIILGRMWREKTGHTIQDIEYARNRHPYWKQKKMAGWKRRNQARWSEHDYTDGEKQTALYWKENNFQRLRDYIKYDKKDKHGCYKHKDRTVAEEFKTSIPSIQHLRRKSNMVSLIIESELLPDNLKTRLELMKKGESWLRNRLKKK